MAAASTNQAGRPQGQEDDRGQMVNKIDNNKSKPQHWCCNQGICFGHTQLKGAEKNIQGVPGGKDLTSGECSLGQTIPI
jgi:hypothetical protein